MLLNLIIIKMILDMIKLLILIVPYHLVQQLEKGNIFKYIY